jgi:hypothetical protein
MKYLVGLATLAVMCIAAVAFIWFLSEWLVLWEWIAHKLGMGTWVSAVGYMSVLWVPLAIFIVALGAHAYESGR